MTACIRLPPYLAFPEQLYYLAQRQCKGATSHLTLSTREGGPNALGGITGARGETRALERRGWGDEVRLTTSPKPVRYRDQYLLITQIAWMIPV